MEKSFLLNSDLARSLYQRVYRLPVIDYHNHLSVADIAENRRFENLYELWVEPDPYKHRAMRMRGVPERLITGNACQEEKFAAWCSTFPKLAGSPLYPWSLMELSDVLEMKEIPCEENWKLIWDHANGYLSRNPVTVRRVLEQYQVIYASPCASVDDDLSVYENQKGIKPSLRGDGMVYPDSRLIDRLSRMTKIAVTDLHTYQQAVSVRIGEFARMGCRFADHSLDDGFYYDTGGEDGSQSFQNLLAGGFGEENTRDRRILASSMLVFLTKEYRKQNMVLQLHMGARRHTSTRLLNHAGKAGGYAAVGNSVDMDSLTRYLDEAEQGAGGLPRIILFALNPADHGMISALSGSYSRDHISGLITQGPAWWWCDHGYGIRSVLENTAAYGLLWNFPGMTTDSRSILSFVRHDYFRRILCDWIAERVQHQDLPGTPNLLEELVRDMCWGNAKRMLEEP